MDTPILLLVWRRPHTLRLLINAIRPLRPTRLYVACDGPSNLRPSEADLVNSTRRLIDEDIDWPCHIERFYSDVNQGCRLGVSRAITWFFQYVDEGIILEDDCVPHPSFFSYCTTMLERYRYDNRIWCISGSNFQNGLWRGDGSYYFSRYNHCWGWASWSRCWKHYDLELKQWPALRDSNYLDSVFEDPVERKYWTLLWQRLYKFGLPDTWDYQWTFSVLVNGGLTVLPNRNLTQNIGFGDYATHTTGKSVDTTISVGIDPHHHPSFILRDSVADSYTFKTHFASRWQRFSLRFIPSKFRFIGIVFRALRSKLFSRLL